MGGVFVIYGMAEPSRLAQSMAEHAKTGVLKRLRDGGAIPTYTEYGRACENRGFEKITGWRSHPDLLKVCGGFHNLTGKSKFRYGAAIAVCIE